MDIQEFAKEVHENAKEHGWWVTEPPFDEIIALIHSEWSEALEEYRAGRGLVWYACEECLENTHPCAPKDEYDCLAFDQKESCSFRGKKPEGIAVELADGVIRIMNYLYHINLSQCDFTFDADADFSNVMKNHPNGITLTSLVSLLHRQTAKAIEDPLWLVVAMRYVFVWIRANGLDPEAIIREKHAYNVTRPYRHGGKVC